MRWVQAGFMRGSRGVQWPVEWVPGSSESMFYKGSGGGTGALYNIITRGEEHGHGKVHGHEGLHLQRSTV